MRRICCGVTTVTGSGCPAIGKECGSLTEYANGYFYFGFQYDDALRGWWFREWLPGAKDVYLFGDFNGWQRTQLPLKKDGCGVWSVFLPDETYGERLVHGSKVKMLVHGDNGWLERIPSYIRRVVQDEHTKDYTGQLWLPPSRSTGAAIRSISPP